LKNISKTFVKKILPVRSRSSNKTDSGKVLVVGGGKGLFGAGILAALSATRSGAGYTHLMTDLSKFSWMKFPDFIVHPLLLSELRKHSDSVIAIGPGLGLTRNHMKLMAFLIKNKIPKVVVDADALRMLGKMNFKSLPSTWILTPHEGELASMLNIKSNEVKKNRTHWAGVAQKKFGCIVLLKGADTLIVSDSQIYQVSEGTRALAKAGSGDVLLGMIAGFYAQNGDALKAAMLASFLHGLSSQIWMKEGNDYLGMRPLDLIERIPKAVLLLRGTGPGLAS
jgi:NAD(P)H-hydrate epimerase